jgi:hypothetical protein
MLLFGENLAAWLVADLADLYQVASMYSTHLGRISSPVSRTSFQ